MSRYRVKAQPLPKNWVTVRSYRWRGEVDDIYNVTSDRRSYLRRFCVHVSTNETDHKTYTWEDVFRCPIPDGWNEAKLRLALAKVGLRCVDLPFAGKVGVQGTGAGEDNRHVKIRSSIRARVRDAIASEDIPHDLLVRLFPEQDIPAVLRMLHAISVPRCSETGAARCPNAWTDEPSEWHKLCKRWRSFASLWHLIHGSLVAGEGNPSWQDPYNELYRFVRSALDGQGGTHCETRKQFGVDKIISVEHVLPDSRLTDKRVLFDRPGKPSPVAHGCNGKADVLPDPDSLPSMGGIIVVERS